MLLEYTLFLEDMKQIVSCVIAVFAGLISFSQPAPKPYGVLPSERQLRWHETEMYCLVHYSMATYTDKEWAFGDEHPSIFTASEFNASQIVNAAKAGGFKGIVVVAKHHDGFCLWPTATTPHNITQSPWKNGKGDIVKEFEAACRKAGVKMGVYCSPWDRNNKLYGEPEYVTTVYRAQLKELYSKYGQLFLSWHDGANGGDGYYGGNKGTRKIDRSTYYGWDSTWGITRKMQPSASIFGDVGPDVRWVGNESGEAGETCWATYTPESPEPGKAPGNGFTKDKLGIEGTRNGKYWMPAECDVPLRPGWFYHEAEDDKVKSPEKLLDIYYKSVGRGAALDLGLAPDKRGLLHHNDSISLVRFGNILQQTFDTNFAKGATFTAGNIRGKNKAKFGPANLVDNDRYSYWATDDDITTPELSIQLSGNKTFNVIRLRENIKLGQRIEGVTIEARIGDEWKEIEKVTSIGANRLIRLKDKTTTNALRLKVTASPVCIALSDFGLFNEPE